MYREVVSMLKRIFAPGSDSELAKRLEQRADLYPVVKRRVDRYLANNQAVLAAAAGGKGTGATSPSSQTARWSAEGTCRLPGI